MLTIPVKNYTLSTGIRHKYGTLARAVAAAVKEIGYEGWVSLELEHQEDTEVTRSMLKCQRESLSYMRQLLG